MRRTLVLALLAVGAAVLSGCGSTAQVSSPIVFGVKGGNIQAYRVSIQPNGRVREVGDQSVRRRQITQAAVRRLSREVEGVNAPLASTDCTTAPSDVTLSFQYVRVADRTISVHGNCEVSIPFARAWDDLARAVGVVS